MKLGTRARVILYPNVHSKDYWNGAKERLTTWLLLEDNGTEDGGKIIAEFRSKQHAEEFASAMFWEVTT